MLEVFTFPKPKGEVSALKMISIFLVGGLCSVSTSAQVEPNLKERNRRIGPIG